jgi:hypothetical protein
MVEEIIIKDLPKISLNEWYAGKHWTFRKKIKDTYKLLIRRAKLSGKYKVEYEFHFKSRPLDCTNTIAMVKMIEDILFENDDYKHILEVSLRSVKDTSEYVNIIIKPS